MFECSRQTDGNRLLTTPSWRINGKVSYPPANKLPINHIVTSKGLNVTVEDLELNLTTYQCFYTMFVPDEHRIGYYKPVAVNSTIGSLMINFPYTTFLLQLPQGSTTYARVGETIHFDAVKQGGGNFTFILALEITGN